MKISVCGHRQSVACIIPNVFLFSIPMFACRMLLALAGLSDPARSADQNPGQLPANEIISATNQYQGIPPNTEWVTHDIGQLGLAVSNYGIMGHGSLLGYVPSFEFPIGSNIQYFYSTMLWVGGILGYDTLVSISHYGSEFWPAPDDAGSFRCRSILRSSPYYDSSAVSEQDFICTIVDTMPEYAPTDWFDNRPHIPLNLSVRQSSYAWSYSYAADFILFHYVVTNIGAQSIRSAFIGMQSRGGGYYETEYLAKSENAITGFRRIPLAPGQSCDAADTIALTWLTDNDGNPTTEGEWDFRSPTGVAGYYFLGASPRNKMTNYNWWVTPTQIINGAVYDIPERSWGPRKAGTTEDPFRVFGLGMGYPNGDRNAYYVLSHPECDYDQLFCVFDHTNIGFMPPPPDAVDIANGLGVSQLLSFGPYDLSPGDSVSFDMVLLCGENFHTNPTDFEEVFGAYNPTAYFATLNFDDLDRNARWAEYVYDNPGVDTDHDGYAGEFCWSYTWRDTTPDIPDDSFVVDSHKVYYKGDSIPDFRTVAPPPAPILRTFPSYGQIIVRWNGRDSETSIDFLTGEKCFEGYRVYMGKEDRLTDFVLLSSYDLEDYTIWEYNNLLADWVKLGLPVTGDSLQIIYGPDFDPTQYYNQLHSFTDPFTGKYRFFAPQDWNESDLSDRLKIHKLYPEASKDNPGDTTEEGYLRYYEYEYVIDNLQPSEPCYLSVTAFSRGSLDENVGVLETSPLINMVRDYPLPSSTMVEKEGLAVIVYPNPYRVDAGYARDGYENRDRLKRVEWSREIHFANLPAVCRIRIYTLSGDLVQEIDHYYPNGGPGSQEETWNMISKNTQSITSGIYIWSVRSDKTEQLGKLVIIK